MSDDSPILGLPYILPSQAQKHVTHNEALRILDVAVQLAVLSRMQGAPPPSPTLGERHIVGPAASGEWVGQSGRIAFREQANWGFLQPVEGWIATVLDETQTVTYRAGAWVSQDELPLRVAHLGVSAAPDATNRLAVSSPATLLNHAGGGHQLKLNKAMASDTASLLFQTGFSGRAEMGAMGSDAFQIKVSADGSTFRVAVTADPASGEVTLPSGAALSDGSVAQPSLRFAADGDTGIARSGANDMSLIAGGTERFRVNASGGVLTGLLTGTAVMQTLSDATSGRLMPVGAFGLGGSTSVQVTQLNDIAANGFYRLQSANAAAGNAPLGAGAWEVVHHQFDTTSATQIAFRATLQSPVLWMRHKGTGVWGEWRELFHHGNIVGIVNQVAGVPTGAVMERGTNANGSFVRYADGTQICWVTGVNMGLVTFAGNGTLAAPFRTDAVSLTWPAAFIAAPSAHPSFAPIDVSTPLEARNFVANMYLPPSATGWPFVRAARMGSNSAATQIIMSVMAVGRWFQ